MENRLAGGQGWRPGGQSGVGIQVGFWWLWARAVAAEEVRGDGFGSVLKAIMQFFLME